MAIANLDIIFSRKIINRIKSSRILIIGSGGIGCELLKNLVHTNFRKVEIIDLDTIELSNLNRQFLFRKNQIGKSKSKIAQKTIRKIIQKIKIKGLHDDIKNDVFDTIYFQQFLTL